MSVFDYYKFQNSIVTSKIKEEISVLKKSPYVSTPLFAQYIDYLEKRIGTSKEDIDNPKKYDRLGIKYDIKKMNIDEYSKELDEMVFKKPWAKLKEFHKIMKIKEFISKLKFGKKATAIIIEKTKKELAGEIVNGLKNKRFLKNKSTIEYDPEQMQITSISSTDFNKKTGLWEIDWDN